MAAKSILFLSGCALVAQFTVGQYIGRVNNGCGCGSFDYRGLGYTAGCGLTAASSLAASHGGGLFVVTSSAAPTGLGIASENRYEGAVDVCGNIPFLGTADVAGEFPTAGIGEINYSCGDGAVAITAESGLGYAGGLDYTGGLSYAGGLGYGLDYGEYVGFGCGGGDVYL
ncbi:chorion class B protein M3A5-like [Bombyx mandarina]|uniref:Chorion class B protein M3A5-like n=1 Tax=Bombyx mandarina TaxID=7092 RepID=A0A6J2JHM0_BOMMA|nr:chorion class B protein M3A5-like [Bombyx mandarina]